MSPAVSVTYGAMYLNIIVYSARSLRVGMGDFLGCVLLTGGDLANFLSSEAGESEYPLSPSLRLTDEENRLAVKGSLFLKYVDGQCSYHHYSMFIVRLSCLMSMFDIRVICVCSISS